MPNKVSEHGGTFMLQEISNGTLRTQDLLRSFASELERLWPFNQTARVAAAREMADALDNPENECVPESDLYEQAGYILDEVTDELNYVASKYNAHFGAHEGDGACFGFWPNEDDDEDCGE